MNSPNPKKLSEDEAVKVAREMNKNMWGSMVRQLGQPFLVISIVGAIASRLHDYFGENATNMIEPIVGCPLVGLCLAAIMNMNILDYNAILKNYVFMFLKGCEVSGSILLAEAIKFILVELNTSLLRNIFSGTALHPWFGFGLRLTLIFHTVDLFGNTWLVNYVRNNDMWNIFPVKQEESEAEEEEEEPQKKKRNRN